jgi:hypothetical protein
VGVVWIVVLLLLVLAGGAALRVARRKNVDLIVRAALVRRAAAPEGTRHIFFCIVDHFEPFWHNRDRAVAVERVRRWRDGYPEVAARFVDRGGRHPRHAFFYPEEEYALEPACLDLLAQLRERAVADVEVHLHHDRDRSEAMRARLLAFKRALRDRHGLLHTDPRTGEVVYGFIHGNWVLANSGLRGQNCGVDDELVVLRETGCYADFTLPSAPHPSQPPVINRIYYAAGDARRPRAHFRATDAELGREGGPGPLIVTGPLGLNWRRRRRGILPAVENGDLTGLNPPSPDRVDAWVRAAVSVAGFPRWVFVKAYTHGAQERNATRLLGEGPGSLRSLFADLQARYDDGARYVLHFATPWEIFRCVKVLEAGDRRDIEAIERFQFRF